MSFLYLRKHHLYVIKGPIFETRMIKKRKKKRITLIFIERYKIYRQIIFIVDLLVLILFRYPEKQIKKSKHVENIAKFRQRMYVHTYG